MDVEPFISWSKTGHKLAFHPVSGDVGVQIVICMIGVMELNICFAWKFDIQFIEICISFLCLRSWFHMGHMGFVGQYILLGKEN